ncbi:MAG: NBR1-Ig-like domain-containing protein [Candidatus Promineifilaceae bacterium]
MVANSKFYYIGLIGLLFALTSCRSNDDTLVSPTPIPPAQSEIVRKPALIDEVEIFVSDSESPQVRAKIMGILPNNCSSIDEIKQTREQDTFKIEIFVFDRSSPECGGESIPFQEFVTLDVAGLVAGSYAVEVNGQIITFLLQDEHFSDTGGAVISGQVWHDLCAATENDQGSSQRPSPGCVERDGGRNMANGVIDPDELGLEGLLVELGEGTCPSTGLAVTITDDDGLYLFSGISAGQYCVSIDATKIQNAAILESGEWTHDSGGDPAGKIITISDGENRSGISFGWDFAFLPLPEVDSFTCINGAKFLEDVTIPDDFEVAPGEVITKTWRVINSGSCSWSNGYGLVIVAGDKLNTLEVIQIATEVAPGEMIDISAQLTAPLKPGIYRGEWMLRDPDGRTFGFGTQANKPIWFQIVVTE